MKEGLRADTGIWSRLRTTDLRTKLHSPCSSRAWPVSRRRRRRGGGPPECAESRLERRPRPARDLAPSVRATLAGTIDPWPRPKARFRSSSRRSGSSSPGSVITFDPARLEAARRRARAGDERARLLGRPGARAEDLDRALPRREAARDVRAAARRVRGRGRPARARPGDGRRDRGVDRAAPARARPARRRRRSSTASTTPATPSSRSSPAPAAPTRRTGPR